MKAEKRLSEALQTLGDQVGASENAYARVQAEWRRRERRRRIVVAALVVGVIAGADGVALWALNSGTTDTHIVDRNHYEPPPGTQIPGQP